MNFFYCFYKMKLHSFTLVEFLQKEGGRENINLLIAPTNHRVVVDTGINHNSGDNSSETDSISRELNEAMDIGSLISGASKKRKTIVEVVRISCASEEEGSSAQLERRSKRRADSVDPIAIWLKLQLLLWLAHRLSSSLALRLPLIRILLPLPHVFFYFYLLLKKR